MPPFNSGRGPPACRMRFDQNTLHTGPADGQRERKRREKRISEALSSGHLGRPLLVSASSHKKSQKGCFSERWLARDSQHPLVLQERIYISSLWSLSGIRGHAGTAWLTALVWTLWDSGTSCERSTPTASVCLKTTHHIDFLWQIVSFSMWTESQSKSYLRFKVNFNWSILYTELQRPQDCFS